MKYSIHSKLDNQKMQFAQDVDAPNEEAACKKALVVMGLGYHAKPQLKKKTAKQILANNGYYVKKS